jgi:hypothetical protein
MVIELTEDEALVLFEMLARLEVDSDERQLRLEHVAERNALWALHAQLERVLVAPSNATMTSSWPEFARASKQLGDPGEAVDPLVEFTGWNASLRFSRTLRLPSGPTISSTPI